MKQKLLLLHGALGCKASFLPLIPLLEQDYELILIDFSGHGGTPFEEDFGIISFAKSLKRLIDSENLSPIPVFGYSMGGYVALRLALMYPKIFNRIFTLGTKIDWKPAFAESQIKFLNPDKVQQKIPAYADFLARTHHPEDWKVLMNKTAEMMQKLGEESFPIHAFQFLEIPVLVALAEGDNIVTQTECESLVSSLKNGKLVIISESRHPIEQVDYGKLSAAMRDFFQ